ncbi:hypothetical protein VCHA53O480_90017 [Vibrio chagasii]|nr:hypothetical protein VCHA31O73_90017 [Vibrio chagasii]CAH7418431.1 hypothetical protein VCHA53O480_90017 [Vibrio chagasii]
MITITICIKFTFFAFVKFCKGLGKRYSFDVTEPALIQILRSDSCLVLISTIKNFETALFTHSILQAKNDKKFIFSYLLALIPHFYV